jgi:acyl-CoA reductase-like NAD-dependent aldehyde dehydrogenase
MLHISGMVGINEGMISAAEAAFGGVKASCLSQKYNNAINVEHFVEIRVKFHITNLLV